VEGERRTPDRLRAVLTPRRLRSALLAVPLLLAAVCPASGAILGEDGEEPAATPVEAAGAAEASTTVEAAEAVAEIAPEDGASEVAPDRPITVQAEQGTLTDVTVSQEPASHPELDSLTGTFNEDDTEWVSDWTMTPGSTVTVTATVDLPDGETTEVASEFSTLEAEPGRRLELASNIPSSGQTFGVGMPVFVNFDRPVTNKAAVTAALDVSSDKPAEGAWNWFGDETVVFRPSEYWEPHQQVTVDMHLAGVQAADGVYGVANHRMTFEVGRSQISHASNDSHRMTVERDGEEIKDFPVSLGDGSEPEYRTTSGNHLVMELHEGYTMDSATVNIPEDDDDYYLLEVDYAMRLTNSGIFAHHSPGNTALGRENISHGCINMSLEDSEWFYENSLIGDPFVVTGTTRELEVTNGWGHWQRPWDEWLAQSPFDEADATDQPGSPGSPFTGG
jgi:lipoprotein-anchoring transpeptidase ErfK/SrfK